MFRDWSRHISSNQWVSSTLSVLHSQMYVCLRLPDCNEVRRVDCGPMTADDDVLQTPKRTGTVRTGTMAPCRVSTERRRRTVWTWCDQRHPTSVERRVEAASDRYSSYSSLLSVTDPAGIAWHFSMHCSIVIARSWMCLVACTCDMSSECFCDYLLVFRYVWCCK